MTDHNQPFLLSPEEIAAITGYSKPTLQLKALTNMGIKAQINARHEVVVSRSHAEAILSGQHRQTAADKPVQPHFEWMD